MPVQQLKLLTAIAGFLVFSLGIKVAVGGGIVNPTDEQLALAAQRALEDQNFVSAGLTQIASRPALLMARDLCQIFIVPVAHQGWHDAVLKKITTDGWRLWYVFDGSATENAHSRFTPLISYYYKKTAAYVGFDVSYPLFYGVIASDACKIKELDWSYLQNVKYKRYSLFVAPPSEIL